MTALLSLLFPAAAIVSVGSIFLTCRQSGTDARALLSQKPDLWENPEIYPGNHVAPRSSLRPVMTWLKNLYSVPVMPRSRGVTHANQGH